MANKNLHKISEITKMEIFKNIFITYNSMSEVEESTALRLQTLSNLYGFSVSLPYRTKLTSTANNETKLRIRNAQFVLAFCLNRLTKTLKEELKYSKSINKPIIIIYDKKRGKRVKFGDNINVKEIFIDFHNTDKALHQIAEFLKNVSGRARTTESSLGVALIGIGLGLLALHVLSNNK